MNYFLILKYRVLNRHVFPTRTQYERKLNDEISKLRQSLQKQVDMLRESSTEALELRLIEAEQSRSKAAKQVHLLLSQYI